MSLLSDPASVRIVELHLDALPADFELLDPSERARAVRFATPQLQRRFIAAHAALRRLLGWAADADPSAIAIVADAQGKPCLPAHPQLHFSLSHCGGQALVALDAAPVGVDIEALIHRDSNVLAPQILAPRELEAWLRLPQAHRVEALTEAWTRKEAALKACGFGLRVDPTSFEAPAGEIDLGPGRRYRLRDLPAVPGHCAALAQSPEARALRRFRLGPDHHLRQLEDLDCAA
ncbi:4'-phosphopantetheinyl transferase family protein [Aquimonas voraii]|uniref:4'-phosphopantetheinyl transferase n=1 Tax=Aquimonas voraii TaxID=265719 RepID=A0A1G7AA76_9GAMM|nr:4'-phosphopantetheinyl transferase superfamily protein [Aquimonas voraii]SDE10766.1 4'-phosphopantetheinyl transferase [Aquimonas voraii]